MTRVRVEGLLAAFPKLVGSGKQHTYVETENVRYVYQPLECGTMYLLLVTTKGSNILEDLDVLRLLAKTLPEYTQGQVDEEGVSFAAFDLIFAFDEIISLGYKENVTMAQVKTFTEMNSHEEKLHKMMIQSKINDTKDVMRRKATEIDKVKLETKMQQSAMQRSGGYGGPSADSGREIRSMRAVVLVGKVAVSVASREVVLVGKAGSATARAAASTTDATTSLDTSAAAAAEVARSVTTTRRVAGSEPGTAMTWADTVNRAPRVCPKSLSPGRRRACNSVASRRRTSSWRVCVPKANLWTQISASNLLDLKCPLRRRLRRRRRRA